MKKEDSEGDKEKKTKKNRGKRVMVWRTKLNGVEVVGAWGLCCSAPKMEYRDGVDHN